MVEFYSICFTRKKKNHRLILVKLRDINDENFESINNFFYIQQHWNVLILHTYIISFT